MNISQPVSSSVDRVEFTFLTKEEIHAVSVKKIENDTTFDTLLNPVRGGLYDPALGSWGDSMYVTDANPPLLLALSVFSPSLCVLRHAVYKYKLTHCVYSPAVRRAILASNPVPAMQATSTSPFQFTTRPSWTKSFAWYALNASTVIACAWQGERSTAMSASFACCSMASSRRQAWLMP